MFLIQTQIIIKLIKLSLTPCVVTVCAVVNDNDDDDEDDDDDDDDGDCDDDGVMRDDV